jgi:undecaprenyl-diphosphatase
MSKFNGLLILPSVLLYTAIDPDARIWLRKPQPYLAAALALVVFAPFVWWNHTHGNAFWIHINAMGSRTSGLHEKFTLKYLGDFLGAQAGLISPLLFLTYIWMLISTLRRKDASAGLRYCWSLSVVVFVATMLLSLKSRVEANWAVAAYLTGFILVAYAIMDSWRHNASSRIWHGLSLVLAGLLTLSIYVSTLTSAGPRIKLLDNRTDELYGWTAMADRVNAERLAMADDPFVFGVNYRMPSELAFYLPGQPQTYSLFLHDRSNEYMFWDEEPALVNRDAIMVNDTQTPDHLDDARAVFNRVVVEPPLLIYRSPDTKPIRTIQIFRCYGFKGYRREDWQIGW